MSIFFLIPHHTRKMKIWNQIFNVNKNKNNQIAIQIGFEQA